MPIWEEAAAQGAQGLLNVGLGLALEHHNDKRQLRQQGKLQQQQIQGQQQMALFNQGLQKGMWEATGYGAQKRQMEEAGLNPGLMYGMGGGGGQTTGSASANVGGAQAPSGGGETMGMMQMALQQQMMQAQIALTRAQEEKTRTETGNIGEGGVDTKEKQSRTELNVLNGIIAKYAGKEAQEVFEKVKQPNRGIEAKTWEDELTARQGVAGTIYDLWLNGKLEEKSLAEIESLLLNNENTRQGKAKILKEIDLLEKNIKGKDLQNMFDELALKLQQETGVGRDSNSFLKLFARLLQSLMSN